MHRATRHSFTAGPHLRHTLLHCIKSPNLTHIPTDADHKHLPVMMMPTAHQADKIQTHVQVAARPSHTACNQHKPTPLPKAPHTPCQVTKFIHCCPASKLTRGNAVKAQQLGDTPDAPEPPLTTTTLPHMMLLLHRIHKSMDQVAWVYAQNKQEKHQRAETLLTIEQRPRKS